MLSDAAGMRWAFGIVVPLLLAAVIGVLVAMRWRGPYAEAPATASALPPVTP